MTVKSINKSIEKFHKLSIQVSLNGLSFCIWDSIANSMLVSESLIFQKELTPYGVQKELKAICEKHNVVDNEFSDIIVIHRNNLFSLVPKSLFDENELANYLKFNTKILANDHVVFDELENFDMCNVYVPFVNINNYIFELFGEFIYKHNTTVMVESLMNNHSGGNKTTCYAHITESQMELTVISNKKLLLYNSYDYVTKEDFMYYLLFTLEQLKMDTEQVALKLFGTIAKGDDLYNLCYQYIKDVSLFTPTLSTYDFELDDSELETIDFTVLSSL
ncbi:DUF3822 family protein [Aurantibacter crassamenti]|uniref:DUF3822 family protein n=1 Tax=Aurantibacter crassamenti TaxID=1837375 RepID=UPI0019398498|nr:DUF3822 family protein [Aurantibacter crassamenti]MBM1107846.1 DUF3822 family protein [Aurantibacter crassamenti]